jgi:hypothetical protein
MPQRQGKRMISELATPFASVDAGKVEANIARAAEDR